MQRMMPFVSSHGVFSSSTDATSGLETTYVQSSCLHLTLRVSCMISSHQRYPHNQYVQAPQMHSLFTSECQHDTVSHITSSRGHC